MTDQHDPYDFGSPPHSGATSGYGAGAFGDEPRNPTLAAPSPDDFTRIDRDAVPSDLYAIVRTPVIWLAAASVLGLAAAVIAAIWGDSIQLAFTAWVLAGPVAIGLLAVHSLRDTALRTRLGYDQRQGAVALYIVAVAAAAVGIGLSAWRIAEWAGRL